MYDEKPSMSTVFTKILQGKLPGFIPYEDDLCAVIMSLFPIRPGHALVIPRQETDHWLDLPSSLVGHLHQVAQRVGIAQMKAFKALRVGTIIAGFEVPHAHIHVVPINTEKDLSFAHATNQASPEQLEAWSQKIQQNLP